MSTLDQGRASHYSSSLYQEGYYAWILSNSIPFVVLQKLYEFGTAGSAHTLSTKWPGFSLPSGVTRRGAFSIPAFIFAVSALWIKPLISCTRSAGSKGLAI